MQKLLFSIGIILAIFALSTAILAQPPRGGRGGGGGIGPGGRGQRPQPSGQPAEQPASETTEEPEVVDFPTSLKMGVVPDLITPQGTVLPLEVADLNKSQGFIPVIPDKAVKYATKIFGKYDMNENGKLERDEWLNMPAAPQQIDLDGDSTISLEEFLRYFAMYGMRRTLHNPNPPDISIRPTATVNDFPTFRPLSTRLKLAKTEEPEKPEQAADSATEQPNMLDDMQTIGNRLPTNDGTETESEDTEKKENNEISDDELDNLSYEQIISGKFRPSEKKYHKPLSELRGVPAWFVRLDKNGDGQLSLIEFDPTLSTQGLTTFGRLDQNGDGVITADEMREALASQ